MMATSSPWSRQVASTLSALGAVVDVVDFTDTRASEYLTSGQDAVALQELQASVHRVHRVSMPQAFPLHVGRAASTLRRIAKAARSDVILTLYGGTNALIAFLAGVRPYVVYVVGSDVLLADRWRRLMSRLTLGRAALVLANGEHLAARARATAPAATVENLYLGIDLNRFPRAPKTVIEPGASFVCTRVFRPIYDNFTVIRALGELGELPTGFRMQFLSAGTLLPDAIQLADRIIAPSDRHKVIFGGWVSDEALERALSSATFYISASLSDGTSSSLHEAMAAGLLPIVSDIPANREWITHGETGLVFPPGDHVALARCIQEAMRGPSWMQSAITRNFQRVEEQANGEANMARLYAALLAVRDGSREAVL